MLILGVLSYSFDRYELVYIVTTSISITLGVTVLPVCFGLVKDCTGGDLLEFFPLIPSSICLFLFLFNSFTLYNKRSNGIILFVSLFVIGSLLVNVFIFPDKGLFYLDKFFNKVA
jgi:hypothetical protein